MVDKEVKKQYIRFSTQKNGVWAYSHGKCGVLATSKSEAIAKIKELYPGEYEIVDIAEDYKRRYGDKPQPKTVEINLSSEERMEIVAEMSKL